MKGSKFTERQIAVVLKQGEECAAVAEICQSALNIDPAYCLTEERYQGAVVATSVEPAVVPAGTTAGSTARSGITLPAMSW